MTEGKKHYLLISVETYRMASFTLLVTLFGIAGYIFINFNELSPERLSIAIGAAILCLLGLFACLLRYNHFLKQVREIK